MSETDEPKHNGEQETGLLAESLFSRAGEKTAMDLIGKAIGDMERGATEQAEEHLRRAHSTLRLSWFNEVSPNLTDEENEEWRELRNKLDEMDEDGYFIGTGTEEEQKRYDDLTDKAYGEES